MPNITYINIDETHRIEVMPSGNYYPQYTFQYGKDATMWAYYRKSNTHKHFKTEAGARKFVAQQA